MKIEIILFEQTPKLEEITPEMFGTQDLKDTIAGINAWLSKQTSGIAVAFNQVKIDEERCMIRGCMNKSGEVYLNPKIVKYDGVPFTVKEGCLTWPGRVIRAERKSKIEIEYQNIDGEKKSEVFDGLEAHVLQHEIDHLNGVKEVFVKMEEVKQSIKKVNIERNEPCPCGSGKKFKNCCINTVSTY